MAYHSAIPVGQQPPPSASRNRRPRTARPALVLLLCMCARGEVTCRDTPPPARGPPPRAATHLARTARLARSRSFGEPIHAPASPVAAPFITCANAHCTPHTSPTRYCVSLWRDFPHVRRLSSSCPSPRGVRMDVIKNGSAAACDNLRSSGGFKQCRVTRRRQYVPSA